MQVSEKSQNSETILLLLFFFFLFFFNINWKCRKYCIYCYYYDFWLFLFLEPIADEGRSHHRCLLMSSGSRLVSADTWATWESEFPPSSSSFTPLFLSISLSRGCRIIGDEYFRQCLQIGHTSGSFDECLLATCVKNTCDRNGRLRHVQTSPAISFSSFPRSLSPVKVLLVQVAEPWLFLIQKMIRSELIQHVTSCPSSWPECATTGALSNSLQHSFHDSRLHFWNSVSNYVTTPSSFGFSWQFFVWRDSLNHFYLLMSGVRFGAGRLGFLRFFPGMLSRDRERCVYLLIPFSGIHKHTQTNLKKQKWIDHDLFIRFLVLFFFSDGKILMMILSFNQLAIRQWIQGVDRHSDAIDDYLFVHWYIIVGGENPENSARNPKVARVCAASCLLHATIFSVWITGRNTGQPVVVVAVAAVSGMRGGGRELCPRDFCVAVALRWFVWGGDFTLFGVCFGLLLFLEMFQKKSPGAFWLSSACVASCLVKTELRNISIIRVWSWYSSNFPLLLLPLLLLPLTSKRQSRSWISREIESAVIGSKIPVGLVSWNG